MHVVVIFCLLCRDDNVFSYRFDNDKDEFLVRVTATVQESLKRVYDTLGSSNPLAFTEPRPAHEELIKEILYNRKTEGSSMNHLREEEESDQSQLLLDADMSIMSMDSIDRQ